MGITAVLWWNGAVQLLCLVKGNLHFSRVFCIFGITLLHRKSLVTSHVFRWVNLVLIITSSMHGISKWTWWESTGLWHSPAQHRICRESCNSFTALFVSLSSRRTRLLAVSEAPEFFFLLSGKGTCLCLPAPEGHRRQVMLFLVGNLSKGRSEITWKVFTKD